MYICTRGLIVAINEWNRSAANIMKHLTKWPVLIFALAFLFRTQVGDVLEGFAKNLNRIEQVSVKTRVVTVNTKLYKNFS